MTIVYDTSMDCRPRINQSEDTEVNYDVSDDCSRRIKQYAVVLYAFEHVFMIPSIDFF